MDYSSGSTTPVRDPSSVATRPRERQVVRAWMLLLGGFAVFLVLMVLGAASARSYVLDATQSRTATLEPVSGQSLLVRSSADDDWRLVTNRITLQEGDTISTGSATSGWITLFDQGTIEVSESSVIRVNRMRTSRLFREHKEIEIEPIRGSIYVGMAPRGEFSASVMRVQSGPVTVSMRDEIRSSQAGSFLVEAQRLDPDGDETDPLLSIRVAVLRGAADVTAEGGTQTLEANQQVVADASGELGEITPAMRELIRNGDFSRHLADWLEYHDHSGEGASVSGVVERVPVDTDNGPGVALQISRSTEAGDSWETGVEQSIGQTLRVHSSLNLNFRLRIDDQQPLGGGDAMTEFPLIVKLEYVDVQGQSRSWWHGFYIFEDPVRPVPEERATKVQRGEWEMINLDLRNLEPLPRQISSIVVYSSGHSYRALVSDLSLTSSETGDDEYD